MGASASSCLYPNLERLRYGGSEWLHSHTHHTLSSPSGIPLCPFFVTAIVKCLAGKLCRGDISEGDFITSFDRLVYVGLLECMHQPRASSSNIIVMHTKHLNSEASIKCWNKLTKWPSEFTSTWFYS